MKTPAEQLKESLEVMDNMFNWADQIKEQELLRWKTMYGFVPNDLKHFLTTHTISILQGEINRLKEVELTYEPDLSYTDPDFRITQIVYEQALQDQILHLEEQIKKIK